MNARAERQVGLTSVGGYVPRYRLSGKGLAQVWGGGGSGERAVANYDEDALTMAGEAGLNALGDRDTARRLLAGRNHGAPAGPGVRTGRIGG